MTACLKEKRLLIEVACADGCDFPSPPAGSHLHPCGAVGKNKTSEYCKDTWELSFFTKAIFCLFCAFEAAPFPNRDWQATCRLGEICGMKETFVNLCISDATFEFLHFTFQMNSLTWLWPRCTGVNEMFIQWHATVGFPLQSKPGLNLIYRRLTFLHAKIASKINWLTFRS